MAKLRQWQSWTAQPSFPIEVDSIIFLQMSSIYSKEAIPKV
jgi:hypothetical protein